MAPMMAHALGEVAIRSLCQQVVVVSHLTIGVDNPAKAFADLPEYLQPDIPIRVRKVDRLAPVSPGSDMVKGAGKLDA
jgi:hypothetical protein